MGHDQLFKEVLKAYFREFLQLFFPDVAEHLDFETRRFLDKEHFTDTTKGSRREILAASIVAAAAGMGIKLPPWVS